MTTDLAPLNAAWAERLGHPLRIGVGIHTGLAQVGNAGSRRRLKYGPRGHTVNLASRIEGATKLFQTPILITGATRDRLGDVFATRRLCRVRVVGIVEPVEVHELAGSSDDQAFAEHRTAYENALSLYESGQWTKAVRVFESLTSTTPGRDDAATRLLFDRASAYALSPPEQFDPVIVLESK
jgi:adenylate cyclase